MYIFTIKKAKSRFSRDDIFLLKPCGLPVCKSTSTLAWLLLHWGKIPNIAHNCPRRQHVEDKVEEFVLPPEWISKASIKANGNRIDHRIDLKIGVQKCDIWGECSFGFFNKHIQYLWHLLFISLFLKIYNFSKLILFFSKHMVHSPQRLLS